MNSERDNKSGQYGDCPPDGETEKADLGTNGNDADGGLADKNADVSADGAAADGGQNESQPELKYGSMTEWVKGGVLGIFIGLAVIIPGVSGSAVAIIMKLYEKLLYAIGNILHSFKKCVLFLLPIALGAVVGFVVGFFLVKVLLEIMMFAVIALFAGLMAGAFPAVKDELKGTRHSAPRVLLFVAGLLIPVAISLIAIFAGGGRQSLENTQAWQYIIYLVIGFAVAITQLVPGLSATALLMTTGHYIPLVDSVSLTYWQSNPAVFAIYACLIAGFVAGLLCFAKLMSLLLKRWHAATYHMVAGLALGSIVTMFFNPEVYAEYQSWAAGERFGPDLAMGTVLFVAGFIIAYVFVRIQRKKSIPLKS